MISPDRPLRTPADIRLCLLDEIADGAARGFVLGLRAGYFHGFVVRRGEEVVGYVDRCPHMGTLLPPMPDAYLTPDGGLIACRWHGALFTLEDGRCVAGPCMGLRLDKWPVTVADGVISTA